MYEREEPAFEPTHPGPESVWPTTVTPANLDLAVHQEGGAMQLLLWQDVCEPNLVSQVMARGPAHSRNSSYLLSTWKKWVARGRKFTLWNSATSWKWQQLFQCSHMQRVFRLLHCGYSWGHVILCCWGGGWPYALQDVCCGVSLGLEHCQFHYLPFTSFGEQARKVLAGISMVLSLQEQLSFMILLTDTNAWLSTMILWDRQSYHEGVDRKCKGGIKLLAMDSIDQTGNIFKSFKEFLPPTHHSNTVCRECCTQEVPNRTDFHMNFDTEGICFNYFPVKQILLIIFCFLESIYFSYYFHLGL